MPLRRAGWPALLSALCVLSCRPEARGRCASQADCGPKDVCSDVGICIPASSACTPACQSGQICSSGTCTTVQASVAIRLTAAQVVGPQRPQIAVEVGAAPGVVPGTLTVEIDQDASHVLAKGSLHAPQLGVNTVVLGSFKSSHSGPGTAVATLAYTDAKGVAGQVQSVVVPVPYDSQAPVVIVFVPPQDSAGGWFSRSGAALQISAQVSDASGGQGGGQSAGSGPASAMLTFTTCPAASACSFVGVLSGQISQGTGTYLFTVPRTAQAEGSDAPLPFTVLALDLAGNAGTGTGTLQIDDKPPALGPVSLVTPGTKGEDGKPWFPGGQHGVSVELSVVLSDTGAGVDPATVALQLVQADVDPGATLTIPATFPSAAPDTAHFVVTTTTISGREGPVRFSVVAKDKLGHSQVFTPATTPLCVDDVPPTVTLAQVDYASAQPPRASVCAQADSSTFACGRGTLAQPDHLLRDDAAVATFDAYDCGVGLADQSLLGFTATTSQRSVNGSVSETGTGTGTGTGTCATGNPVHHFSFHLLLPVHAPALDAADASGATPVQLVAHGLDRFGDQTDQGPGDATSGPGVVLVSLVRWRTLLAGPPSGSGVLLPGSSPRIFAVGIARPNVTDENLFALDVAGGVRFHTVVSPAIAGDLAVGPSGTIYAVSGEQFCSGGTQRCSTLNLIPTGVSSLVAIPGCQVSGAVMSAPPVVFAGATESAVAVATARDSVATDDLFAFSLNGGSGKCQQIDNALLVQASLTPTGDPTGISGAPGSVFISHADGFSSLAYTGSFGSTAQQYSGPSSPASKAAPALSLAGTSLLEIQPVFSSAATDQRVRRAASTACTQGSCWETASGFTGGASDASLSSTPVFDGSLIYAADDLGTVYAWDRTTGSLQGNKLQLKQALSPPILLDGAGLNPLLVVTADGFVRVLVPGSRRNDVLLQTGHRFTGTAPQPPAVDRRELRDSGGAFLAAGGLAYLTDGEGWVWALQLANAPLAASATVWPRPGRDSCNSRNAAIGSSCP